MSFPNKDGNNTRLFGLVLIFRFIRVLWQDQLHSCSLAHGCGEDEEGNQQEAQIHHGRQVTRVDNFFDFLTPGPFLWPPPEVSISAMSVEFSFRL